MSGSWLVGVGRVIPYLLLTFGVMPVQALALIFSPGLSLRVPRVYHRWAAAALGLKVVVRGRPAAARPTLFVANHTSYFDIEVLGSLIEGSFIAKSDMRRWPLFGWLARLQRSVFIDRRPVNAADHAGEVAKRLAAGDSLILFAEGTTSDGNRLLPFKSALFAPATNRGAGQASAERPLTIQPVSVVATALDGIPLGRALRPLYAWYGDMPMAPHLWQALSAGRLTVEVEFHPPFVAAGLSRKQLANRCEAEVRAGVARAITGRFDDALAAPAGKREYGANGDEIDAAA
jgi:1-acyl-sn-glycerol-3-phosphate acyltransferase